MKTKKRNYIFLAVLMMGIAMMMTACADNDLAGQNAIGDKIAGTWTAQYDAAGTIANKPYTRVLQVCHFNATGTGYWCKFFFGKDSADPIAVVGGENPGSFTYSSTADGLISAKLNWENAPDELPHLWTMQYADGSVSVTDGDRSYQMSLASEALVAWIRHWDKAFNGGAAADNYNINDKDFTPDKWRQQEAIFIYDGVSKDIKDDEGNEGYAKVNLPWYNGTIVSNLPMDFCDDITPENGWVLLLNNCGLRSTPNGNFFALYNNYLGTLRFFYYMPQGYSAGNDHLWQVTLTQGLAERYDLRYGIPMDKTVSAKDAYGLTQDGTSWADYITPYVSTMSNDGFITPNGGWWAFDVDLSLYRSETIDPNAEKIRLQMRSWDNSHVSLHSTFTAESKGDIIDLTKASASKSKGLFGKISAIVKTGTDLGKTVISLRKGDLKGGIKSGIAFGKDAASLKSTFSGGGSSEPSPTGTISINTQGTADTDGTIKSSQPTVGVVSPTFFTKDFHSGSTVGQGIWNIKSTPKIYTINSANSLSKFIPEDDRFVLDKYGHPLPPDAHGWMLSNPWLVDAANWTFFDPSSVEVVLNPNVFPEDQIEWMQVDAVAGLRKSLTTDEVDMYRATLGMDAIAKKKIEDDKARWTKYYGDETNDYVFDYKAAEGSPEQALDLSYPKSIDNGKTDYKLKTESLWDALSTFKRSETIEQELRTFGAGAGDDYIIEPQMTFWRDGLGYMKSYQPGYALNHYHDKIAEVNRADTRNGKSGYDELYIKGKFNPNSDDNGYSGYIIGYDGDGKNGYPKPSSASIDIKHIPAYFPTAEVNVTLTIKMKNMAEPIVFNRIYLPEYEYVKVVGDEKASLAILDRIFAKKNLSPKTAGHTQSYDFQAARINKCFKLLFGYSK